MTEEQFKAEVWSMIHMAWGVRQDYKEELYYQALAKNNIDRLKAAIKCLITTSKYLPTISEIYGKINELKAETTTKTIKKLAHSNCPNCEGSGMAQFWVWKNHHPYSYVCLCNCQAGRFMESTQDAKTMTHVLSIDESAAFGLQNNYPGYEAPEGGKPHPDWKASMSRLYDAAVMATGKAV